VGLRIFNLVLEFHNRPRGSFTAYTKKLSNNEQININHPESFDINSKGKNTILLIGDSFGVGYKCGNLKNIAGCLKSKSGKHVVNLSIQATTPAQYLKSLKSYIEDQRKKNKNINGETVNVLLYSNDILIDYAACNYLNSNQKLNLENSERNFLNSICSSEKNDFHYNQIKIDRNNKYWVNLRKNFKIIYYLFGKEVYLLFEEIAGRLILSTDIKSLGRSSYVQKWGNQTAEAKLVANILNDIKNYCDEKKCNPIFTFFPNVEDLNKESKIYNSYISFQKYMLNNYQIKVFNGYEPFFEKSIKRATYSLTDVHSNCKGYEIYANWLLNLN
tara:strand:- start:2045 stop:3034 length:990 start_codon:yes stop_codon:yes gene_type:complete